LQEKKSNRVTKISKRVIKKLEDSKDSNNIVDILQGVTTKRPYPATDKAFCHTEIQRAVLCINGPLSRILGDSSDTLRTFHKLPLPPSGSSQPT